MFTEHVHSRAQARDTSRIKVLSAAEELFVRHGFASTTIRQIAESAAVSVGTVMAVADKNGLLVEIVDRKIASIQASPFDVPIAQDPAAEIIDTILRSTARSGARLHCHSCWRETPVGNLRGVDRRTRRTGIEGTYSRGPPCGRCVRDSPHHPPRISR
jgi:AcrR family transcriptional regulator